MELRAVSLDDLAALRRVKIDGLRVRAFPYDHGRSLEGARGYRLLEGSAEVGYALHDPERSRLLEFEVGVPWRGRAAEYFADTVHQLEADEIEVRSDDGAAFEAALGFVGRREWNLRLERVIYALETGMLRRPPRPEAAEVRPLSEAESEAAGPLWAAHGGDEGLAAAAREERAWGLWRGERLAGVALVRPQAHHRYADLRPVVDPEFRRSGLATYLVGEVSQALLNANHRLLTALDPADRAPRRMAENLGLHLAAHRLLLRRG